MKAPDPVRAPEPEAKPAEPEIEAYTPDDDDGIEDLSQKVETEEMPEEFIDESNPFYVKKQTQAEPAAAKAPPKDSSDAAGDILRKMMDRRRASKSS